jgi:hypothetical protein
MMKYERGILVEFEVMQVHNHRRRRASCNGNTWSQKVLPGELPAKVWILTEMCHSGRWCTVTETPYDR